MLSNSTYQLNNKKKTWIIWVEENSYNIRENENETLIKTFNSEKEALVEAEKLMNDKIKEGYFHILYDVYGIVTNLEDSNHVEAVLEYYFSFLKKKGKTGYISQGVEFGVMDNNAFEEFELTNILGLYTCFQNEHPGYSPGFDIQNIFKSTFYFFSKVISLYPEFIPIIEEYLKYAVSLEDAIQLGDDEVAFAEPILALVMSNQKYVKGYMKFLSTNDLSHETFQPSQIYYTIKRWGTNETTLPLIVARCCQTLHGQSGMDSSLFIDTQNQDEVDQFFQLCILDMLKFDKDLKSDYVNWSNEEIDEWAEDTLYFTVGRILKEMNIDYDKEKMLNALKTMDLDKPPKLSDIIG